MAPSITTQRNLRLLTLFGTALAIPMLIGITIIAENNAHWRSWGYYRRERSVTAFPFAFIPLVTSLVSGFISVMHHRKKGTLPSGLFGLFDVLAIASYIAILVPIWVIEVGKLHQVGHALLLGYTTAPMIVNMITHMALFGITFKTTMVALRETFDGASSHECPNCGHGRAATQPPTTGPSGYSLLRGEVYLDDDATPRQSADLTADANAANDASADDALLKV